MNRYQLISFCVLPIALLVADASTAEAQSVSVAVGGDVSVRASGRVHARIGTPRRTARKVARRARRALRRARVRVGVGVGVGVGVRVGPPPPPPPCWDRCTYATPVYAPPPPVYTAAPVIAHPPRPVAPRMPRFGIGAFAGSVEGEGSELSSDLGLLAQYNFGPHLSLEGELSEGVSELGIAHGRVGGALKYNFMPWSRLSPSLLVGTGVEAYGHREDDVLYDRGYAEVGVGLTMPIGRHIRLMADARAGVRDRDETIIHTSRGGDLAESQESEDFSRVRFGAMFMF